MKLKEGFLVHQTGDEYIMVATGQASRSFNGLIRNNATANYIAELLQQETTKEEIIEKLLARYDVERAVVERDVDNLLQQFEEAGLLE